MEMKTDPCGTPQGSSAPFDLTLFICTQIYLSISQVRFYPAQCITTDSNFTEMTFYHDSAINCIIHITQVEKEQHKHFLLIYSKKNVIVNF